ncbi:zinc finger translocation-associated protein-like [Discoglossus pictus]
MEEEKDWPQVPTEIKCFRDGTYVEGYRLVLFSHRASFKDNKRRKMPPQSKEDVKTQHTDPSAIYCDLSLEVISLWHSGIPYSKICSNLQLHSSTVQRILHVWHTEKRLTCRRPVESGIKEQSKRRKTQVPTMWRQRFLVAASIDGKLQCMVCDKVLSSAKMRNITQHIELCHPCSLQLSKPVRKIIHQAWECRQAELLKTLEQENDANDGRVCAPNMQDQAIFAKTESANWQPQAVSTSGQQRHDLAYKKPQVLIEEAKLLQNVNSANRLLCLKEDSLTPQINSDTERLEGKAPRRQEYAQDMQHKQYIEEEQNIQTLSPRRKIRGKFFHDRWSRMYLVVYDETDEMVVCLVCGARFRTLKVSTYRRHAERRHPESLLYPHKLCNTLLEAWCKREPIFPLI